MSRVVSDAEGEILARGIEPISVRLDSQCNSSGDVAAAERVKSSKNGGSAGGALGIKVGHLCAAVDQATRRAPPNAPGIPVQLASAGQRLKSRPRIGTAVHSAHGRVEADYIRAICGDAQLSACALSDQREKQHTAPDNAVFHR